MHAWRQCLFLFALILFVHKWAWETHLFPSFLNLDVWGRFEPGAELADFLGVQVVSSVNFQWWYTRNGPLQVKLRRLVAVRGHRWRRWCHWRVVPGPWNHWQSRWLGATWDMLVGQVTLVPRAILPGLLRSSGWCWCCWRWWSCHNNWGLPEFWQCQEWLRHPPVGSWGSSLCLHAPSRCCCENNSGILFPFTSFFWLPTFWWHFLPCFFFLLPSALFFVLPVFLFEFSLPLPLFVLAICLFPSPPLVAASKFFESFNLPLRLFSSANRATIFSSDDDLVLHFPASWVCCNGWWPLSSVLCSWLPWCSLS